MFHSISPPGKYFNNAVSDNSFTRQLLYLKKHYAILKLGQDGQLSGFDATKINVLLTFDDGFIDNYLVAAPILARLRMPAIFFLIAQCLLTGCPPSYLRRRLGPRSIQDSYRTITTAQARELITMGMTVGSHSLTHSDYGTLTTEEGVKDAIEARVTLEKQLGCPVLTFAFPWGKYKAQQLSALRSTYRFIFTTKHGFNAMNDFLFNRSEVAGFFHLCCTTSGALDFFKSLTRRPWLPSQDQGR